MLELLIVSALGAWLFFALRTCVRRKGGCQSVCSGNCAHCKDCGK